MFQDRRKCKPRASRISTGTDDASRCSVDGQTTEKARPGDEAPVNCWSNSSPEHIPNVYQSNSHILHRIPQYTTLARYRCSTCPSPRSILDSTISSARTAASLSSRAATVTEGRREGATAQSTPQVVREPTSRRLPSTARSSSLSAMAGVARHVC